MAQIQQHGRGGWWRLVVSYQGKRHTKALQTRDQGEAEAAKLRVAENLKLLKRGVIEFRPGDDLITLLLSDGRLHREPDVAPGAAGLTLGKLVDLYQSERPEFATEASSQYTEDIHLRHVVRVLGEGLAAGDVPGNLQSYISSRKATGVSRDTIHRELTTLATAWNRWAVAKGLVAARLVLRDLRFPKSRQRPQFQSWEQVTRKIKAGANPSLWKSVYLSAGQLDELVDFVRGPKNAAPANPLVTAMMATAAYTGARRAEMIRARVEDFDFTPDRPQVTIREKKRDRESEITFRHVPMAPRLVAIAWEYFQWYHPGGAVAFCRKETPGEELTPKQAYLEFRGAVDGEGSKWGVLKGWHAIRHSFVSCLVAKGVHPRVIMELAGHLDEETSRRYQHVAPSSTDDVIRDVFGK